MPQSPINSFQALSTQNILLETVEMWFVSLKVTLFTDRAFSRAVTIIPTACRNITAF
eukprot:c24127_g1_i3 orf=350-520(+)